MRIPKMNRRMFSSCRAIQQIVGPIKYESGESAPIISLYELDDDIDESNQEPGKEEGNPVQCVGTSHSW